MEIDPDALPACGGGVEVDDAPGAPDALAGIGTCADGSEIDVLVLYTPVARAAMGSTIAIEAEITLAVVISNLSYFNSQIGMQLNLVHMQETPYNEVGTYSDHLNRLATQGDGFMDEAHLLRYEHQADMVALIVNDGENCGIASLLPSLTPAAESSMFSVTTWYCAAGSLVFAHELGHNMGCCHAPGDGGGCTRGGFWDYSVGYRYFGNSGTQWRTVMAYAPGTRIQNFSNPDVFNDGDPTGIAVGQPGEADNAITINQTRATIASFRCGLPYCQVEKEVASDGGPSEFFGTSVGMGGDAAIVGAILDSSGGFFSGAAYVYRFDGSAWAEEQELLAPDAVTSEFFGYSVAIDGDLAVIGAIGDNDNGTDSGSAYVFRYDGSWSMDQKLLPTDGETDDRFGSTVAISGEAVVVGAFFDSDNGNQAGSAYVFRYDSGTMNWVEEDKLVASVGVVKDQFGTSVSIDGDVIIVGAPSISSEAQTGSAYVYRYDGGTASWGDEVQLLASDGTASDRFGYSVSMSGNAVVIGAVGDADLGILAGAAYIFEYDGAAWQEQPKLLASDGTVSDGFGTSVSISGPIAVIGADGRDDFGDDAGGAYVFRRTGSGWQPSGKLLALDGADSDTFGFAVSVRGQHAVIGARQPVGGNGVSYMYSGFTGTDCNANGVEDGCEILSGAVTDANGNGESTDGLDEIEIDRELVPVDVGRRGKETGQVDGVAVAGQKVA